MKLPALFFFAALAAPAALSQAPPPQPADYVAMDRHCKEVHPGDTVSYSLSIEGLPSAQPVFADLQMRPQHELPRGKGLPSPDFHNLGGGGSGAPNGGGNNNYGFSFVVPKEIYSGRYRGVEIRVEANVPVTASDSSRYVDVSRHTLKRVHEFCLNVVSSYGAPEARPEVTNFQTGAIVPRQ